jgi:hypothetical protein
VERFWKGTSGRRRFEKINGPNFHSRSEAFDVLKKKDGEAAFGFLTSLIR